ncbi:MAG TPA: hypothetical protein VEA16_22825 [Vicinamibacterales bacterium]|nr:hypothetical protein [Vicinamibacterales bacterium]
MNIDDPARIAAQIDEALAALEASGDTAGGAQARELARSIMALYGQGLSRMVEIVRAAPDSGLLDRLAGDPLIASLLALHGLHPESVEARITRALAALQPALPMGMDVVLASTAGGDAVVNVTFHGAGPFRHGDIRRALTRGIQEAAPEIESIRFNGLHDDLIQIMRPGSALALSPSHGR